MAARHRPLQAPQRAREPRNDKPRHGARQGAASEQARPPRGKGKGKGKDQRRPPQKGPERPPVQQREPRIDKDSPFAVLSQLRSELAARGRRGD